MFKKWILVANSSYAQIFEMDGKKIHSIEQIEHEKGRKKPQEIASDKPGRTFAIASMERHALGEIEEHLHRHEEDVFAHQLISKCRQAQEERRFDQMIVIASPEFLGILRHVMKHHPLLQRSVTKEIPKTLSFSISEKERVECVQRWLELS